VSALSPQPWHVEPDANSEGVASGWNVVNARGEYVALFEYRVDAEDVCRLMNDVDEFYVRRMAG